MSEDPPEVVIEDAPPSDRDETPEAEASHDESDDEAPVDLMVKTRERRSNAGNRMATLLAKSAEEEEWGEEWEEAPNEEEFRGDDVNEQEDYNMDSSSSEEDDDGADEDDAGEKELRKAERHERNKKRKAATNPFTARAAAAARKKKKSERASWLPTEEDGPVRMSKRKQTVANKDATLAKLKEKDRRRDDTLAMMKAAEARKMKAKEKPLTQAERLAEAARNERINKKTLHRWEEAEEARAAERQAKIDALKNRQIDGPFYRYYSGPGIWVDDKLKYTGKDAPSLEHLDEKLNKEVDNPPTQPESTAEQPDVSTVQPEQPSEHHADDNQPAFASLAPFHPPMSSTHVPAIPATLPQQETSQVPWTMAASQGGDVFMGSHGMTQSSNIMFAPPNQDSFLYGIDHSSATGPQDVFAQFQKPAVPPPPPRRKTIRRALRNLLILSNFPNLEAPPLTSSRSRMSASLLKDKDKSALVQLYVALFNWTPAEATSHIHQTIVAPPKPPRKNAAHKPDTEIVLKPGQKLCPITNSIARYRDPETGIAYRDARAFGVLRGVVGGGFVWSGDLGCYVGGRAKPLESMGGKGFLGMPPAKNVPRRFWETSTSQAQAHKRVVPPPTPTTPATTVAQTGGGGGEAHTQDQGQSQTAGKDHSLVVTTSTNTTTIPTTSAPVKTETSAPG
ncbi:hypothetical protein PTNB73_06810 [Pyrenophora teres f. teres]|nr:hypothetical protein PTNB73_06810 [Pyrenophora teres f. teres]